MMAQAKAHGRRGAGAHWRIPSDHLPVGLELRHGRSGPPLRVVSWNVLSSALPAKFIEEHVAPDETVI